MPALRVQIPQVNPKLDDKRRERLMNIKKREELKDVLIYKFKEKYGDQACAPARGTLPRIAGARCLGLLFRPF